MLFVAECFLLKKNIKSVQSAKKYSIHKTNVIIKQGILSWIFHERWIVFPWIDHLWLLIKVIPIEVSVFSFYILKLLFPTSYLSVLSFMTNHDQRLNINHFLTAKWKIHFDQKIWDKNLLTQVKTRKTFFIDSVVVIGVSCYKRIFLKNMFSFRNCFGFGSWS